MQRAASEDHAILGAMGEFDPLGRPGKDHRMLAHHSAAAQRGEADIARLARAGDAVAAAFRMRGEIDAAAGGGGATEHKRSAGRRVDLFVVMHLENFDVVIVIERLRHALDQRRQEIDAETHIAGFHDRLRGSPPWR